MVSNVEGRVTLQHESGQLLLSFGQAVGRQQTFTQICAAVRPSGRVTSGRGSG
jgi:hypothetical protein